MHRFARLLGLGMDCLSGMLLLTPPALCMQKVSGRRLFCLHTWFLLLYVCTLMGIFSVTGLPNVKYCQLDFTANWIPMADLLKSPAMYLLNVLMFVPIGFLLPLLWKKYGDWKYTIGFAAFLTIFIEVAQVFTFRTTDIDDLITNVLGAAIGFLVVRKASRIFQLSLPLDAKEPARREDGPVRFLLLTFLVYFFLYPFWSAWLWDTLL